MKYITIITILFLSLTGFSQSLNTEVNTYAVVVGISDYQDEAIPDLRFADKDAEAFAGFLQSPAGGSLDEDHLKVLINEQATVAQFAMQLDWLWEVVKEGDRVIIYFSGHGDVERKSITQPGYLLCWDAPSQVYLAGGAMNVRDLNDVVSTLSIQNKAKVILITDACRAGKLSGSSIGGAQATAANLAKQYANEIKILSCQPDEYSIEGEQWGGGRGAFSYHLLDGLYGLADDDEDMNVNLKEIGRYLEDRVSEEVAPQSQNPMTVGSKTEKLTDVFPEILEQLKEGRKGQMQMFTATESRSIEDDVLAAADTNIVELYLAFKDALKEKNFLCSENTSAPEANRPTSAKASANNCADFYYLTLSQEPQLERLHSSMRRNYAAALQDDAQQVLNKLLKSDPAENTKSLIAINAQYKDYPKNLRKAASLLGKDHYMFNVLMARSYWFEGYINDASRCACKDIPNAKKVIPYYEKALEYQPEMPHAWLQLAALYGIQKQQADSSEYYAQLVKDAVPQWTLVYQWMGNAYLNQSAKQKGEERKSLLEKAEYWLKGGQAIDSNSVLILNELAYLYNLQSKYEKEQETLDRSFLLEPLAQTMSYKGEGFISMGKYEQAEKAFMQAAKMDSSFYWEQNGLGNLYALTLQHKKLKDYVEKALQSNLLPYQYYSIGNVIQTFVPEEALKLIKRALETEPNNVRYLNSAAYASSYLRSANRDLHQELAWHKKGAKLSGKDSLYSYIIFLLNVKMQNFKEAERIIEQALKDPNTSAYNIANRRFLFYFIQGNKKEAEEALKERIKLGDIIYTSAYGRKTYPRYLPNPEQTQDIFELLLKWHPNVPEINFDLAVYHTFFRHDDEAAYAELEKAFEKGFDDYDKITHENWLFRLRIDQERWQVFLKKHFPEQHKTINK